MLLFCLLIFFCSKSEAHENVTTWSFREENQLNENSYAIYSGPYLKTSLMDFTLCFRYKLLFLNDGNSGVNIFRCSNTNILPKIMTIIPFGTTAVVKRHTPASTIVEVITGLRPNLFSISGCKRDKGIIRNVGKMKTK